MGALKVNNINFNNAKEIHLLNLQIQNILNDRKNYHVLEHSEQYYFSTPNGKLPAEPGWYIILCDRTPIYVGRTKNLNSRLNTENGSRDQFANPKRKSDSTRNFIKKYREIGITNNLCVCIVRKTQLSQAQQLTNRDCENIEKHINIWRCLFTYKKTGES